MKPKRVISKVRSSQSEGIKWQRIKKRNDQLAMAEARVSSSKGRGFVCSGCGKPIKRDKFLLKACDKYWHENCLKCDRCQSRLGELGSTLYFKADMNLCRQDYLEMFGETGVCSVCEKLICASEMVMRAKQNVYHLECFACQLCSQRFCVGERFYLCENKVVCQYDYEENILPIQRSLTERHTDGSYESIMDSNQVTLLQLNAPLNPETKTKSDDVCLNYALNQERDPVDCHLTSKILSIASGLLDTSARSEAGEEGIQPDGLPTTVARSVKLSDKQEQSSGDERSS